MQDPQIPGHDADELAGLSSEQSRFYRAQAVTSAVDYEYFDVGIGQVAHMHTKLVCIFILLRCR